MHAALMWTISDFLAYVMVSEWSTHVRTVKRRQNLFCNLTVGNIVGLIVIVFFCLLIILTGGTLELFVKKIVIVDHPPRWLTSEEVYDKRINQIEGLQNNYAIWW